MAEVIAGFFTGIFAAGVTVIAVLYFRRVSHDPSHPHEGPPTPARIYLTTL